MPVPCHTYTRSIVCECTAPFNRSQDLLVGLHRNVPEGFLVSIAVAAFLQKLGRGGGGGGGGED